MGYPHKYKYGKQTEIMEQPEFQAAMQRAEAMGETLDKLAFLVLVWYCPVRKSEAYERQLDDVTVTKDFVTVDFGVDFGVEKGHRKKHGEKVPPLDLPRAFFGVEDWLIPHIFNRIAAKPPHKFKAKRIRYQVDAGKTKTRITRSGKEKTVPAWEWREEKIRAVWLFPYIGRTNSLTLVKRVFGEKYYVHYFRLRKISAVAANPATATIIHLKSVSGIKTTDVLDAYLGVSKKAQDQAMQVE